MDLLLRKCLYAMIPRSLLVFVSLFLLIVKNISTTGPNEIRDIQALIDYDKQLELLQQQYTGKLSENVGFSLLYHMREDRWKQGGDWEALYYTNNAIDEIRQNYNFDDHEKVHLATIFGDEIAENMTLNTLKIVNDSLPLISEIELFNALTVHKIRLLTILGRYSLAQAIGQNISRMHIEMYGYDSQLLNLQQKLKDLEISHEISDALIRVNYLIEFRALLYFISGQAWLSSGDAFTSVSWFEKAILLNPCLHQAYYQLSQAVAASPFNNPHIKNGNKSILTDDNSIGINEVSRRKYMESLVNKLENLLYRIYLDPNAQQVVLLRHPQASSNKVALTLFSYFSSFFPVLSFSKSALVEHSISKDNTNNNILCVFGDELQYFHVLLQYSQVSDNSEDDNVNLNHHRENVEVEDSDDEGGDLLSHSNFKITLKADHPAAFAQQSQSTEHHSSTNQQASQQSQALPQVSRDYVKVVQAAIYWSLFTLSDALSLSNDDQQTLSVAFFYLQQARALERFRAHHPLYALYSADESQRQAAHILRVFTSDYYPRPAYPDSMPMSTNEKAFVREINNNNNIPASNDNVPIFAHDLAGYLNNDNKFLEDDDNDDDTDDRFYGSSIQRPVFIVGFFRSGSTLLEKLLTQQDPRTWGLGEHSAFATQMHRMQEDMLQLAEKFDVQRRQYTSSVSDDTIHNNLRHMQETMFRDILRKHARVIDELMVQRCTQYVVKQHNVSSSDRWPVIPRQCTRIVDKMLLNYRNIGLIHLLFPQATVLHTVRDPVDTMWSCMTHRFGDEAAFTLDVQLLVPEFLLYLSVMEHFRRTLPARPPVWGHSSLTNQTKCNFIADGNKKEKKTNKKATEKHLSWKNFALCNTHNLHKSKKNKDTEIFNILCHQQLQVERKKSKSNKNKGMDKVPLQPLIDVRYDTVVTRATPLLQELQYLLQLSQNRSFRNLHNDDSNNNHSNSNKIHPNQEVSNSNEKEIDEIESAPIRTASFLQVRRPINTAAQGKWLRYAAFLKYNLLPLWQKALFTFYDHPLYQLLNDNNDNNNNSNKSKIITKKQKRNAWKELVPFVDSGDEKDQTAMNWLGDKDYPYTEHLVSLAEEVDRLCVK